MYVLILGGGEVGAAVARRLIRERNEVVIVEGNAERCAHLEETLDAKLVQGNAGSISTLEAAGLNNADMLIAVTNSDEANLLGCLIAQAHSKIKIKVVRLRTHDVDRWRRISGSEFLNIDLIIHPDRETATRMLNVLGMPGVSSILEFAGGRVKLFGMNVEDSSWVIGKSMAELDRSSPPESLMAMIFRGHRVIIPRGDDRLMSGDHVYIVTPSSRLDAVLDFMGVQPPQKVERVFILGGKQLGIEVALQLEQKGVQVKLFEKDLARCEKISTLVEKTIVVHADGTDQRILAEENIEGIDAYLALTGDDEENIIASLLSRRLGARKVVALINRLDFLPLAQLLGINSTFSTRLVVVDRILQFVRKGHVVSVTTFREEEAEAIELLATERSKYVGKPLKNIHFPKGSLVGAIARPNGEVIVPRGDAVIQPNDRVIFFCLENVVPELESAFIAEYQKDRA
ncbi:MAG: Trk system potassium transporter TrkA [Acidobacteriota bacterium]